MSTTSSILLPSRRRIFTDKLEKSNKAKIEVSHFVSSILTSCMVMLIMFGQLGIDQPWCDSQKEEALLWCSSKHFESESFDQRCSVNLFVRRVLSRIVLLQESAIDRHHERIVVWSYEAVCSIWVDWLYYKWSFPFGLELYFRLMSHGHGSSDC